MARSKKNLTAIMGRPTVFNAERAGEVLRRLCAGETLLAIGRAPGMPAPSTVRDWAQNPRFAWFGLAYKEARREQARALADQTLEISDLAVHAKTSIEIYGRQLQVNTRRWMASRLLPEEFGDRMTVEQTGRAEVHIHLPSKNRELPGDDARVIEGSAERLADGSEAS